MQNIEKRIYQILCYQFEVVPKDLAPDVALRDHIGMDSLDAVELVISLEETFDVTISDAELERLATIRDIVSLIEQKIQLR